MLGSRKGVGGRPTNTSRAWQKGAGAALNAYFGRQTGQGSAGSSDNHGAAEPAAEPHTQPAEQPPEAAPPDDAPMEEPGDDWDSREQI